KKKGIVNKLLEFVETAGNKLPDTAILFFILMLLLLALSAIFSTVSFSEIDPTTGTAIEINNLLTSGAMADFLSDMVSTFMGFAPFGIVLVALLFAVVADHSG